MARSSFLTAGFLLIWAAALSAHAAAADDQTVAPSPVATQAPTPLQEPHAVDQAPLPPIEQVAPAKRAQPSAPRRPAAAKSAPARPQAEARPRAVQQTIGPKARPAPSQVAAKPAAPPHPKIAVKPKPAPRKLATPHLPRVLAQRPRHSMREARRNFEYRVPEGRPHSGPVYDTPPSSPALAKGCDEACQYRDWLNRYAAWYRDFGHYYYGAAPRPVLPGRPVPPPMTYSENRPALPAYRPDQGERDRLDPWHGYNPHSPANGY